MPASRDPSRSARQHVRFVLLNDLNGVLEPCGCTRASAGGLDRIATLVRQLKQDGVPTFTIVAGDTFRPPQRDALPLAVAQDKLKNQAVVASLGEMSVSVVVPSVRDIKHSGSSLRALSRASIPVLSTVSNNELEGAPKSVVLDVDDGVRIGVTAGDDLGQVAALSEQQASFIIGVDVTGSEPKSSNAITDLMVRASLGDEKKGVILRGEHLEVVGGARGEELWIVDAWLLKKRAKSVQLVTTVPPNSLASDHEGVAFVSVRAERITRDLLPDPAIRKLLDQVFVALSEPELVARSPADLPSGQTTFVGSDTCAACHTQVYDGWRSSKHGRAFLTLVERHRALDLECLSCHVTGYGEPGGASITNLAHLKGVGCESCHGPGAKHVEDPRPPFRVVRREVPAQVCERCHDARHSDDFSYERARMELDGPAHRVMPLRAAKASDESRE